MDSKKVTPEMARQAEALVAHLDGVASCRIRLDADGGLGDVHVVARSGKSPRALAREVETALRSGLDLEVDAKRIGVVVMEGVPSTGEAEAESGLEEFPILEQSGRFAFVSVHVSESRDGRRAEVELSRDGAASFGAADTDNVSVSAPVVIAEATLRAVSEFLDGSTRLCLSGVRRVQIDDGDVILVRVDVVGPRCAKGLAGCALVGSNESQSAVFATLDAVNRVIGKLDFSTSIEYKIQ